MKWKQVGNKITVYTDNPKDLYKSVQKAGSITLSGKVFKIVGGILILRAAIEFLAK